MQKKYFLEFTYKINEILKNDAGFSLTEAKVIETFNKICLQQNISEYYLLDTNGSFLLLTAEGKKLYFIIKNSSELEMYYDFAKDSKVEDELCNAIKQGIKIPYFSDISQIHTIKNTEWPSHLYPATPIEGSHIYYALIEKLNNDKLINKDILSYNQYLINKYRITKSLEGVA